MDRRIEVEGWKDRNRRIEVWTEGRMEGRMEGKKDRRIDG